jgi:hypothetical protein
MSGLLPTWRVLGLCTASCFKDEAVIYIVIIDLQLYFTGSVILIVVPRPGLLSSSIVPL